MVNAFLILLNDCFKIYSLIFIKIDIIGGIYLSIHIFFHGKCTKNLVQVRKFNSVKLSGWHMLFDCWAVNYV